MPRHPVPSFFPVRAPTTCPASDGKPSGPPNQKRNGPGSEDPGPFTSGDDQPSYGTYLLSSPNW